MSGYELNSSTRPCPACDAIASVEAVLCTRCGLNFQTGRRTQEAQRDKSDAQRRSQTKSVHRCPCGYDLTGLGGKQCPECGRTPDARRKGGRLGTREDRRQEAISNYWRSTWLVFAIGSAVGGALTLGVGISMRHYDVLACLQHMGLCQGALLIGYFAVCLTFLGFEEDVRGLVLRLIGVGAVWAGLLILITMIPPITTMMAVGVAVMSVFALALPLSQMTDREYTDSSIIAVASWALYFVAMILIQMLNAP